MLKRFLLLIYLLFAGISLLQAQQEKRDSLPYQKYPTLPAFNILLQDSTTIFNTYNIPEGRPTVLMFFSPDCDHCQQTTKALMDRMDSLSHVQFYLFTPMSLTMIRAFGREMKVNGHKNVMLGQEYQSFFPRFYGANFVPYVAIYDRKKKFVKMFEGRVRMEDLMPLLLKL